MLMPFIRNDDNWHRLASSECCITMSTNMSLDSVELTDVDSG